MELDQALELGRNAFWMALSTSAPILVIGLVVGLVIALFQAVTQLQEQTLTFVPKIAAMVVAATIFIPWISQRMMTFTQDMLGTLPY
ncbi:MAG: flagellar biosynthesis protein FliQ [Phycisphaerae bacterium]